MLHVFEKIVRLVNDWPTNKILLSSDQMHASHMEGHMFLTKLSFWICLSENLREILHQTTWNLSVTYHVYNPTEGKYKAHLPLVKNCNILSPSQMVQNGSSPLEITLNLF